MSQAEKAVNKAADTAKDVAQDVADTAKEAVNTTRRTAANALDKAEEGVKSIERELNPVIDDLAARAQELATRGINFCADSSDPASCNLPRKPPRATSSSSLAAPCCWRQPREQPWPPRSS